MYLEEPIDYNWFFFTSSSFMLAMNRLCLDRIAVLRAEQRQIQKKKVRKLQRY